MNRVTLVALVALGLAVALLSPTVDAVRVRNRLKVRFDLLFLWIVVWSCGVISFYIYIYIYILV